MGGNWLGVIVTQFFELLSDWSELHIVRAIVQVSYKAWSLQHPNKLSQWSGSFIYRTPMCKFYKWYGWSWMTIVWSNKLSYIIRSLAQGKHPNCSSRWLNHGEEVKVLKCIIVPSWWFVWSRPLTLCENHQIWLPFFTI